LPVLNDRQGNNFAQISELNLFQDLGAVTVSVIYVYSKFTLLIIKSLGFVLSVEREKETQSFPVKPFIFLKTAIKSITRSAFAAPD
jgi:hypothetical protein